MLFFVPIVCSAQLTTLTDTQGRSISVQLIDATDKVVKCKISGHGAIHTIELEKLDEPSEKIVKDWLATGANLTSKLTVFSVDIRKETLSSIRRKITPTIKLKNLNLNQYSKPGVLHLYLDIDTKVPYNESSFRSSPSQETSKVFKYDVPSIAPNKSIVITATPVEYVSKSTIITGYSRDVIPKTRTKTIKHPFNGYGIYVISESGVEMGKKASANHYFEETRKRCKLQL